MTTEIGFDIDVNYNRYRLCRPVIFGVEFRIAGLARRVYSTLAADRPVAINVL